MPALSTIALFALAAVTLAVVPGPAVAYVVTQSVDRGRRAGVVCALGVASGGLVHVAAATVGLSALIASSATAFTAIKLVDLAYALLAASLAARVRRTGAARTRRYVTGGIFVALGVSAAVARRAT